MTEQLIGVPSFGHTRRYGVPVKISMVAPDLRAAARRMPSVPANQTLIRLLRRLAALAPEPAERDGVTVTDHTGTASWRVYTPTERRTSGALLWIHGGGLVLGDLSMDDPLCTETARRLGVVVVSANYRLAPEHPFPAPLEDCFATWVWLLNAAPDLGVDPDRIVIGGQSAGGGLAAALVQRIHDVGGPQPVAQWLFCPMLDDRTAADRGLDAVGHRVWNNRANRNGWTSYLAGSPTPPPPYAVPARRADLTGLPPAWIGVGDIDLFHDEDLAYARRLGEAGVEVGVDVVPGAPHGFESWARTAPTSLAYLERAQKWLQTRL
jgi:acetyl esterase/lipase